MDRILSRLNQESDVCKSNMVLWQAFNAIVSTASILCGAIKNVAMQATAQGLCRLGGGVYKHGRALGETSPL